MTGISSKICWSDDCDRIEALRFFIAENIRIGTSWWKYHPDFISPIEKSDGSILIFFVYGLYILKGDAQSWYSVQDVLYSNIFINYIFKDARSHSYEYNVYTSMNLTTRP